MKFKNTILLVKVPNQPLNQLILLMSGFAVMKVCKIESVIFSFVVEKMGEVWPWFSNPGQSSTWVEVWIHILEVLKAWLNKERKTFFLSCSSCLRGIKYQTSRTKIRCFVCYSNKLRMIMSLCNDCRLKAAIQINSVDRI